MLAVEVDEELMMKVAADDGEAAREAGMGPKPMEKEKTGSDVVAEVRLALAVRTGLVLVLFVVEGSVVLDAAVVPVVVAEISALVTSSVVALSVPLTVTFSAASLVLSALSVPVVTFPLPRSLVIRVFLLDLASSSAASSLSLFNGLSLLLFVLPELILLSKRALRRGAAVESLVLVLLSVASSFSSMLGQQGTKIDNNIYKS